MGILGKRKKNQLHGYCEALESADAVAIYIKWVDMQGKNKGHPVMPQDTRQAAKIKDNATAI